MTATAFNQLSQSCSSLFLMLSCARWHKVVVSVVNGAAIRLERLRHVEEALLSAGRDLSGRRWPPNFRQRALPLTDRHLSILWQRLRLPLPVEAFTGRLNLFHSPDFVLPPVARARTPRARRRVRRPRRPRHGGGRGDAADACTRCRLDPVAG